MGSYNYTFSIGHLGEQLTLNQWVLGSSPRWRTKKKPYRNVGLFSYVQPLGKQYPVRHRGREQLRRRPPPAAETGSRSRGSGRRGGAPHQGALTDAGTATCQGPPVGVPAGFNSPVDC